MSRRVFILSLLIGIAFPAICSANMLSDPGFESGQAGYAIKDGPWTWSGGGNGQSFYTTDEARTGTQSAKAVIWGGASTDYAFFNEDFTNPDFNLYTFSGYFLWNSTSEPLRDGCEVVLQVKWLDSLSNVLLTNENLVFDNSMTADEWHFVTFTSSAPPQGAVKASATLLLRATESYTANSAIYIDDMTFEVKKGNLTLNAGFEDEGWPPANWAQWDNSVAGYITTDASHSGLQAVVRELYGSGDRWGGYTQEFAVSAGEPVTVSGWMMSDSQDTPLADGAEAFLKLEFVDASENVISTHTTTPLTSANDKWDYYEIFIAQAPTNTVKAKFSFVLTGNASSSGKVYFDDASISTTVLTSAMISGTGYNEIETGLLTEFYKYFYNQERFNNYAYELPDYDQLTHYKVDMVSWINFSNPASNDFLTPGVSEYYGANFEGYLYIPEDDTYTFYLDTEETNVTAVYISDMESPELESSLIEDTTECDIYLEKGLYPLKIEHFHNYWTDKVILKFSSSSIDQTVIPSGYIFHAPELADSRVSAIDSDGDKLTDADEIGTYGTDPYKADSDGDGLSDSDEINKYNTNALSVDSDSDGLSDYTEAMITFSLGEDPLGTRTVVQTILGANTSARVGEWAGTASDAIYSVNFRGELEYNMSLPSADVYCLTISAKEHYDTTKVKFEIDLYIDDHYIARNFVKAEDDAYEEMIFLTPYLASGAHTIRLVWDNGEYVKSLDIASIKVESIAGDDTDSDGIKDWVEERLASMGTVDNVTSSKVSPVCLEGNAYYPDLMTLNTGTVNEGPGFTWYSDVTLDPDQATGVTATFQNGGQTVNRNITWTVTDVFEESSNVKVRAGDSLLLNPYPTGATDGSAELDIDGTVYQVTLGDALEYEFSQPDDYTITATYTDTEQQTSEAVIHVEAVALDLPITTTACLVNSESLVDLPTLPEGVVLESDPRLEAFYATGEESGTTAEYAIAIDENKERRIAARLGEDGPILSSMTLQGVAVYGGVQTWIYISETLPDGSEVIKMGNVLTPILSDVEVHIELFLPGVLFDDASTTKVLTSTDYNERQEAEVTMIKAPSASETSACHHIDVYQDTRFIGRAY